MPIHEAAQPVLQAAVFAEGGDVFLLDMGEPVRIKDLAEQMVRLSGLSLKDEHHPKATLKSCAPASARAKNSTKNS
jgi:FlaA1/EpsC-like NDP-sugar epimerase